MESLEQHHTDDDAADNNDMGNGEKQLDSSPSTSSSRQLIDEMQYEMLNELQTLCRRKRMELRHRAITLIERCVVVEEGGERLSVCGGTTLGNDIGNDTACPLGDAYQVLSLFADSNFPTFGETLDGAMKCLSRKLFEGAIGPCLSRLELSSEERGTIISIGSA
jgi:hypothetical protein